MKKLFNRFQSASKDFTPSMLPQTRREVFFDVLKLNWKSFLLYGLLFLALCLPLQLVTLSESMAAINLQNAAAPREQIPYMIAMTRIIAALVKIPCFLLIAVGISGFVKVIRQYAWMENVNFSYEFRQGVKSNAAQMLPLALLTGLLNAIAALFIAIGETTADLFIAAIVLAPTAIIILCLLPVFAYMVVSISVYKSRLADHFRVGRFLYSQSFWKTLLALVCCFAPFVLQVLPTFMYQIIGAVLSPLLSPVVFLGWYLFSLDRLDQHINQERYPSLVGKGLYDPDAVDEDAPL